MSEISTELRDHLKKIGEKGGKNKSAAQTKARNRNIILANLKRCPDNPYWRSRAAEAGIAIAVDRSDSK